MFPCKFRGRPRSSWVVTSWLVLEICSHSHVRAEKKKTSNKICHCQDLNPSLPPSESLMLTARPRAHCDASWNVRAELWSSGRPRTQFHSSNLRLISIRSTSNLPWKCSDYAIYGHWWFHVTEDILRQSSRRWRTVPCSTFFRAQKPLMF